jgi:hypothetical protein
LNAFLCHRAETLNANSQTTLIFLQTFETTPPTRVAKALSGEARRGKRADKWKVWFDWLDQVMMRARAKRYDRQEQVAGT